jgi:hypothetical protein
MGTMTSFYIIVAGKLVAPKNWSGIRAAYVMGRPPPSFKREKTLAAARW